MDNVSMAVGNISRRFRYAEGGRRHLRLGFSAVDADPLAVVLRRNFLLNGDQERSLE